MENHVFLAKVRAIVLAEISSINVVQLAARLAYHPAHVYRKIDAILNCSPSIFIRDIRLEEGAALLTSTNMMVKDVAYTVGFNTPSYFIECFKEKYQMTPEKFRRTSIPTTYN